MENLAIPYKIEEKSFKHYTSTLEKKQTIYWQFVMRVLKLKHDCQINIRKNIEIGSDEIFRVASLLRIIINYNIDYIRVLKEGF